MGTPEVKKTNDTPDIDYEKRYKDTQADHTRISQEKAKLLKDKIELEAELNVLREQSKPKFELPKDEQEALDELKFSDPDAWRSKVNELESKAIAEHDNRITESKTQATQQLELNSRVEIFEEFQKNNPDVVLTDDLLKYDIPPRISAKLENKEVTYREFLQEVVNFVKTPKIIGTTNQTLGQPNLVNAGGDDSPTRGSVSNVKYEELDF